MVLRRAPLFGEMTLRGFPKAYTLGTMGRYKSIPKAAAFTGELDGVTLQSLSS